MITIDTLHKSCHFRGNRLNPTPNYSSIMKHIIKILFFMLSISNLAHGRVGETVQEITARFGQGKPSGVQRQVGAETWKYAKNGFLIEVVFSQGKSIWEIYQKQGGSGSFPESDIENILDGYKESKENKRTWRFDRREKRWEISGKPKLEAYLWPSHEDFFCIKDIAACEALAKQAPGSKGI